MNLDDVVIAAENFIRARTAKRVNDETFERLAKEKIAIDEYLVETEKGLRAAIADGAPLLVKPKKKVKRR